MQLVWEVAAQPPVRIATKVQLARLGKVLFTSVSSACPSTFIGLGSLQHGLWSRQHQGEFSSAFRTWPSRVSKGTVWSGATSAQAQALVNKVNKCPLARLGLLVCQRMRLCTRDSQHKSLVLCYGIGVLVSEMEIRWRMVNTAGSGDGRRGGYDKDDVKMEVGDGSSS